MLLKYKRSNELREFFESKYHKQERQVKVMHEEMVEKDEEISELTGTVEERESEIEQ